MNYKDSMLNTIDVVLSWDLPDVALVDAVRAHMKDMAGFGPD